MKRLREDHSEDVANAIVQAFNGELDTDYIASDIAEGIKDAAFMLDSTMDREDVESLIDMVIANLEQ